MDGSALLPVSILVVGVVLALVIAWRRGGVGQDAALETLMTRALNAERELAQKDVRIGALERKVAELERELSDVRRDLQASYRLITEITSGKARAAQGTLMSFSAWLARHFSADELKALAADCGIDGENVKGDTTEVYARELVGYAARRGATEALQVAARRARPDVEAW